MHDFDDKDLAMIGVVLLSVAAMLIGAIWPKPDIAPIATHGITALAGLAVGRKMGGMK